MNYPNEIRNKAIVILRKLDPETYKFKVLAELMPGKTATGYKAMHLSTIEEIYKRDMYKYDLLPTTKALQKAEQEVNRYAKKKER
jgi:hypothetical protein